MSYKAREEVNKMEQISYLFAADLPRIRLGPAEDLQDRSASSKRSDPAVSLELTDRRQFDSWLFSKNNQPRGSKVIYVGMDVSGKEFVIHAINDKKKAIFKGSVSPTKKGIRDLISDLGMERKVFVFEAGNQMKWIADTFKKLSEDFHVVHPNEVKWIAESGGKKTDKVDARKLSELARADMLPRRVFIAEGKTRTLRELTNARETLLRKRVSLINSLRGYLRQENVRLPAKFFQAGDWQVQLIEMKLTQAAEVIVASFMSAIENMIVNEKSIADEIVKINDKVIERIETIPGIGKLTSRILFGALADVGRFENSKCVASYGALSPTIYQSGDECRMGPVTQSGRKEIRRAVLQCAHAIVRMKAASAKPLQDFFNRIEKKCGKKRALIALSRKLLTVVYAVWKSEDVYNPKLLRTAA
jgi:transposase